MDAHSIFFLVYEKFTSKTVFASFATHSACLCFSIFCLISASVSYRHVSYKKRLFETQPVCVS